MKRTEGAWLAAGLALYASLAVSSLTRQSATYDEGAHLPAGYSYLVTGDHRLNPEHPPLAKLIAAAPLLLLGDVAFRADDLAWSTGRQWELGRRFLYAWNDADRLLFWGRLPIVALGAALCAALFLRAHSLFGPLAGAVALVLAVLSPDLLAHGQLVTTDLPVALFLFLSVTAWQTFVARPSVSRLLLAGLATAAAVATKFSALVLFPILAVLVVVEALSGGLATVAFRGREHVVAGRGRRLALGAGALGAVAVMSLLGLWAAYGFSSHVARDEATRSELLASTLRDDTGTAVARVVLAAEGAGLLPEAYTRGFLFAYRHAEKRPTFLRGRISEEGFAHFFAVSFLVKTPIPLIVLLLVAAAAAGRGGLASLRDSAWLWVPVAGYLLLTQTRGLNIGHRHLLPVYPFLIVAAAGAAARLLSAEGRWRSPCRAAGFALLAWYAGGTLLVHPHHLAYFNEVAGGPRGGYHWLVDSSLDWGQDLKGLGRELRARGLRSVKLSYFGSADPSYYGIDAEMLPSTMSPRPSRTSLAVRPGDVLAVSATSLQGVYLDEEGRRLMARVRALPPFAEVGHSIFLFRSDFAWPPP